METGVDILRMHPPDELTPNNVAARAGVSRALVFHYFPTTDALRSACAGLVAQRWVTAVAGAMDAVPQRDELRAGVEAFAEFVAEEPEQYAAVLAIAAWDVDFAAMAEGARQILSDVAARDFRVSDDPMAATLVRGWEAMTEQTVLAWARDPRITKTEVVDLLMSMLTNALGAGERRSEVSSQVPAIPG